MQWLVTNCLNGTRNCANISRSQISAPTGSFPSGDGQSSGGSGGGAGTATQQEASTPATERPQGQEAQASGFAADAASTAQGGDGTNDGDQLAATGPSASRLPLGAGVLLAVGVAIVAFARYRPRHAARR